MMAYMALSVKKKIYYVIQMPDLFFPGGAAKMFAVSSRHWAVNMMTEKYIGHRGTRHEIQMIFGLQI